MPAAMGLGLETVADAGYVFSAWTGNCSGLNRAYYLRLDGAKTCSATFTSVPRTTPTVSWKTPTAIRQGVALSATQLNATASIAWHVHLRAPAGRVLAAGTDTLTATFTPTDLSKVHLLRPRSPSR